ncbi:MAG: toxin [Burkholderiaceae bacterium]|nr:toxin [Burkholderiaceae bacterium]
MKAVFVELPALSVTAPNILTTPASANCMELLRNPSAGDVIEGTGGLRKMRFIDKDEMSDLTAEQRKALKTMIKMELEARRKS